MLRPTDTSPNGTANEGHHTYEGADKIIQKLSPDMAEHIFRFISGEEVMRTADIAHILGYLGWKDIMRARVSRKWREAATMTIVPTDFAVRNVRSYNVMKVMTTALPNMQRLSIRNLNAGHKYSDGEDPDLERNVHSGNYTTHDICIISNFRKLRALDISRSPLNGRYRSPLNGRYPVLFNFPLLRRLRISCCENVRFDLDMLSRLPLLKELDWQDLPHCTGNLRSLRALKSSLRRVRVRICPNIRGNFMDLAYFPHLKRLDLDDTFVSGDIRDIGRDDFPALTEGLILPKTVHGGMGCKFHSVSDVPSFMQAIHLLRRRTPSLYKDHQLESSFGWKLSKDSEQWYDSEYDGLQPPFKLECVTEGSRFGWRWKNYDLDDIESDEDEDLYQSCEMNWLDAGPNKQYLQKHLQTEIFTGYNQPPTEDEFCQLLEQREMLDH